MTEKNNKITDEAAPKLWERQPWDTAKAYDAFTYYYLMEPHERTLAAAYKAFATKHNIPIKQRKDAPGSVDVPLVWRYWCAGTAANWQRPQGTAWENALPWRERAAAYDRMVASEIEAEWRSKQKELRRQEWKMGQALIERGESMLTQFQPDSTEWTEDSIARLIKEGLSLKRRAAGMPDKNVEVSRDWQKEMKALGLNPNEFVELFAGLLAAGAEGETNASATGETS